MLLFKGLFNCVDLNSRKLSSSGDHMKGFL